MAGGFGDLLRLPGSRTQALFGLAGRAPGAMLSVGYVAAASSAGGTEGYALGGLAAGAYALSSAAAGPVLGRLADRHGQGRTGRPLATVSASASLVAVATLLVLGATPLLVACAAVAGLTQPNVSAFARVRWSALLADRDRLSRAQALESVIDETTFLLGPPLVALLAGALFDGFPIALAALLLLAGVLVVTSRRALPEPPPHPDAAAAPLRPEFPAGIGLLVAVLVLGGALGAVQVLQLAYCDALGFAEGAALVFFVNSGASLVGAVVVGSRSWRTPPRRRFTIALVAYAAALVPSALVAGYWPFVAASLLSGIGIAPTFVQANAVVGDETPARSRTAAFALLASSTGLGIAAGAALAGLAVSAAGADAARLALLVPSAAACALVAIAADRTGRAGGGRAAIREAV